MVLLDDTETASAYAAATKPMREAILGMVDSHNPSSSLPTSDSRAMRDEAGAGALADPHGWGSEPAVEIQMHGSTQAYIERETSAAIAEGFGSSRAFVISPCVLLRVAAESSGRAQWVFEPEIGTLERIVRVQNLKIEDFYFRSQMKGADKSELIGRIRHMQSFAEGHGRVLTKRVRRGTKFIEPLPPTNSEFIKMGFSEAGYAGPLSRIASAAIHGSMTAMLSHIQGVPDQHELERRRAMITAGADTAILLMIAAGFALQASTNAEYDYYGAENPDWFRASDIFMNRTGSFFGMIARLQEVRGAD